jgi:hypothetical protein
VKSGETDTGKTGDTGDAFIFDLGGCGDCDPCNNSCSPELTRVSEGRERGCGCETEAETGDSGNSGDSGSSGDAKVIGIVSSGDTGDGGDSGEADSDAEAKGWAFSGDSKAKPFIFSGDTGDSGDAEANPYAKARSGDSVAISKVGSFCRCFGHGGSPPVWNSWRRPA